jgi:hypothetical protein
LNYAANVNYFLAVRHRCFATVHRLNSLGSRFKGGAASGEQAWGSPRTHWVAQQMLSVEVKADMP